MAKINDFGEKIGGARKDVWKLHGIKTTDLSEMNAVEKESYVKKDNVWPKPDWVQAVSSGTPQVVAFWQNEMRKSIPPKPPVATEQGIENYVKVVGDIKDAVMAVKNESEIESFYKNFIYKNYISATSNRYVTIDPVADGIVTNKVLKAAQKGIYYLKKDAQKVLFGIPAEKQIYIKTKDSLEICRYDNENVKIEQEDKRICLSIRSNFGRSFYYIYNTEQFSNKENWQPDTFFIINKNSRKPVEINIESREVAEELIEQLSVEKQNEYNQAKKDGKGKGNSKTSNRKGPFIPPQLKGFDRTGPKYRKRSATGNMYMDDLKFRAGEFGNWMDERDRQVSLDMGYDALKDLARVLNIRPEDISLGGKLAIAFGARGRGGANAGAAHYETERQVINLTKMSGAGCLAHEWAHALDHSIGISLGSAKMASEASRVSLPQSFKDVLFSLKYKEKLSDIEEVRKNTEQHIKRAKNSVIRQIEAVKPYDMTEKQKEKWDILVQNIIEHADDFTGIEYVKFGKISEVLTNPHIEALSLFRKDISKYSISRDTKKDICISVSSLKRWQDSYKNAKSEMHTVETQFYKDSGEFDRLYSKGSHGYWQSTCEMFARAFDCYVSDKLKEAGQKSEYLTAYANSFISPDGKGGTISAIPLGEERKVINEKFDLLIKDLKERNILHHFVEEKVQDTMSSELDWNNEEFKHKALKTPEDEIPVKYKQMSFADLISNAATRAGDNNTKHTSYEHDHNYLR